MQNPKSDTTQKPPLQWTILKLIEWTTSYFASRGVESPRPSAEILLASVLNLKRYQLYVQYDKPMEQAELTAFKQLIKRRAAREPVAYIVGHKEFWSMDLLVSPRVLIPRPETECVVETAIEHLKTNGDSAVKRVLELGTGSGAIILALASEDDRHLYFASDLSRHAIDIARTNAAAHGLTGSISFFCGNWFNPLDPNKKRLDIILSNPPYIKTGDIDKLQPEIKGFEPGMALDGGSDGLNCIRKIIENAYEYLVPDGSLFLEIGYDQQAAVADIAKRTGQYRPARFRKDYAGNVRVLSLMRT